MDIENTNHTDAAIGRLEGPVQLTATVHVITADGRRRGAVEIALRPGRPADANALSVAMGRALHAVGEGGRLLSPHEFFNDVLIPEHSGGRRGNFAVPSDFGYDTDSVTAAAVAAFQRVRLEEAAADAESEAAFDAEDDDLDEEAERE